MVGSIDLDGCGRCSVCGSFFPFDEMYNGRTGDWECIECFESDQEDDESWEE